MARNSRLKVCLEIEIRNSSQSHWMRSIRRQRTTPWMAGMGPCSTMACRAARCASVSFEGWPGGLRLIKPAGPWALNFTTQSRTICTVTPPSRAAAVRVAPHRSRPGPTGAALAGRPWSRGRSRAAHGHQSLSGAEPAWRTSLVRHLESDLPQTHQTQPSHPLRDLVQESVYADVAEPHPEAAVVVPPRSTAVPSATAETAP